MKLGKFIALFRATTTVPFKFCYVSPIQHGGCAKYFTSIQYLRNYSRYRPRIFHGDKGNYYKFTYVTFENLVTTKPTWWPSKISAFK